MPARVLLNRCDSFLCSVFSNPICNYSIVNTHFSNESAEEGRYNKGGFTSLAPRGVNTQNHGERK